jgi:lipopolysaccharide/colanic/teichoic acid biosynthesis glycosyltransferase
MLRANVPASRAALRARVSVFDTFWAFASPLLALAFRDAYILSYDGFLTALFYCLLSAVLALAAFLIFRLQDGILRYFSAHDALDVVKAVVCAELMTSVALFTLTRLEGIPRSTPLIHALILAAGLIAARLVVRLFDDRGKVASDRTNVAAENVIMIGETQQTSLYIKLLDACSAGRVRVIALLDDRPQSTGRSISGVRILGASNQLECIIDEFAIHGMTTDKVIIGGGPQLLADVAMQEIRRVCARREIKLDFVPRLVGISELPSVSDQPVIVQPEAQPSFALPRFFEIKPIIDFFVTLSTIVTLPLIAIAALLVLLDVGSPVLFWQQRVGKGGRSFLLIKFRTLRPPFDSNGRAIPEEKRISLLGKFLRQTRLDELPQLLNVLVGDMSLIGPRPLLPEDQPANPTTRLLVRPGITGWAQVNGGKFLTPQEKDQFDEFYIRNASPWFDLHIAFLTLKVLFRRNAKSDHDVAAAFARVKLSEMPKATSLPRSLTRPSDAFSYLPDATPLHRVSGIDHLPSLSDARPPRKSGRLNG